MRSFLFDKGMDAGELVGGGHVEGGLMCAGPINERCLLVIVATCHRPTALRASVRDLHSDVRTGAVGLVRVEDGGCGWLRRCMAQASCTQLVNVLFKFVGVVSEGWVLRGDCEYITLVASSGLVALGRLAEGVLMLSTQGLSFQD